ANRMAIEFDRFAGQRVGNGPARFAGDDVVPELSQACVFPEIGLEGLRHSILPVSRLFLPSFSAVLRNLLYDIINLEHVNIKPSRETNMPKLKLPNIEKAVAIDIHTHAEEPCGMHGDDGYDDFQAQMAEYFKSPHKHPPTVPETAAHYRDKKIAAVIFPVDAE